MRGLADLIRPDWLRMFSPDELQMLISGAVGAVDLVDLRANTVYGGGYSDEHPSIQIFWQVLPPAISCGLSDCVRVCVRKCGGEALAQAFGRHAPFVPHLEPLHPSPLSLSLSFTPAQPPPMQVVEGFDKQQRESLLMFVTSCSRPPLLGFRELHPNFCIQKTSHSPEEADSRLPTAATCMNMLKLPCYNSADACRDRLLYAINAGAGFELS